jgi:hypothetical protein
VVAHRANVAPSLGFLRAEDLPPCLGPHFLSENNMNIEMKTVGFAIYDAPAGLRKFLEARASGAASKELLAQLSADAMAEQEADRSRLPRATLDEVVIDFQRARRERTKTK